MVRVSVRSEYIRVSFLFVLHSHLEIVFKLVT